MSEVLNSKFNEIKSSILRTVELAKIYGSEDMQTSVFYKKLVDDFCEIKEKAELSLATIQCASNCESLTDFDKIISEQKQVSSKGESVEFYDEIKQILESNSGAQIYEDGDMEMQEAISDIDPLTKKKIVNPVKNKQCGHVYDKVPILDALRLNSRLRCPVAGCGSRTFIKATELVEDEQFRRRLQNSI